MRVTTAGIRLCWAAQAQQLTFLPHTPMMTPEVSAIEVRKTEYKYWAFISYSHRDTAWAEWVHRRLESYNVPGDLIGRTSRDGPLPHRLIPVFRDRDELSAVHDLGLYIKSSLALSRHLVVICSPNSAHSPYVDGEIRYFKSLGREDRVHCLIVDGEPGDTARECFPEAVRFHVGPDEQLLPEPASPIAADARPQGDGRNNAFVKLLAGILNVNYDDLVRREKRRALRRRIEMSALAALVVLFFGGLWHYEEQSKQQEKFAEYVQDAKQAEDNGTLKPTCFFLAEAGDLLGNRQCNDPDWQKNFSHAARGLIKEYAVLKGHQHWVCHCVFSPDGSELLSCAWDSTVRTWKMADLPNVTGRPVHTFKEKSSDVFLCANYNPVGDAIVCATWWSALAWVTDLDGDLMGRIIDDHRGRVNYVEFNSDGTQILTASDDCTARTWDTHGNPIRTFTGHKAGVKTAVFNANGSRILTAGFDGLAIIWDTKTGHQIRSVKTGDQLNCAEFSPDGKTFVTAGLDGKARLWSSSTGDHPFLLFREHHGRINSAQFDHRGDRVVTTSDDGTAKVWNVKDGSLVASLEGHTGAVLWATFSNDDKVVATSGKDKTIRIWRLADLPEENLSWAQFESRVGEFGLDPKTHDMTQDGQLMPK
jgi:hypothetical protein